MKIPTLTLLNRAAESRGAEGRPNQGETLDRLGLKTGESRLARLLSGNDAAGNTARNAAPRLLLEISGQQIPVRSEQALQAGSLVRVMRAGNELQLMEMIGSPGRSTLSQSLAHRIPSQHHLGEGLTQLLNRQPDASIPQPARQTLQTLLQMLPRFSSGPTPTGQNAGQTAQTQTQTPAGSLVQRVLATTSADNLQAPAGKPPISLSPPETISADRVRDWLNNSGLFREARMITASASPGLTSGQSPESGTSDLKAQLIRLVSQLVPAATGKGTGSPGASGESLQANLNALRPATTPELTGQDALRFPAPIASTAANTAAGGAVSSESISAGETLRLLAGMINRITVNQLHSQAASTAGPDGQPANQTWILELPWVNSTNEVKLLQGRLEERGEDNDGEGGQGGGAEREWRLNLALELDGTGPVYFDVALQGRQLRTTVWAERQATAALVHQTRTHLESALARLDLDVKPVECLQGKPQAMVTKLSQQLVDEHA